MRNAGTLALVTGGATSVLARLRGATADQPHLEDPRNYLPSGILGEQMVARRQGLATVRQGVRHLVRQFEGPAGPLDAHLYLPTKRGTGALLWFHDGARVTGSPVTDHAVCSELAQRAGILVVSLDHRLAPSAPYPAALDDAWACLEWLQQHHDELGIDLSRIAIGGAGAGGGLAAELAQRCTDGLVPIALQLLLYPMLDDTAPANSQAATGPFAWTREVASRGWAAHLAHPLGETDTRPWAVAAARNDLRGLPPAWIGVGELDLFRDEALAYGERLRACGVHCEMVVQAGLHRGASDVAGVSSATRGDFRSAAVAALAARIG